MSAVRVLLAMFEILGRREQRGDKDHQQLEPTMLTAERAKCYALSKPSATRFVNYQREIPAYTHT
jgi:hypothetical protein